MRGKLIFFSLLLVFLTTACFTYEDVDVKKVEDVRVENLLSSDPTKVTFDVRVHNPNGYAIKIKDVDLNLFVGNKDLGKLKLDKPVKFPRKKEAVQSITIVPDKKDILQAAAGAASGAILSGKVKVKIKGRVKGKVMGIGKWFDVSHTESIPVKDLMKYFKK